MADTDVTTRWIDRVWTISSGLLIVTLAGMAGVGVKVYDQSRENAVRLETVMDTQAAASKQRDAITQELLSRSARWLSKDDARERFTFTDSVLSDHEARIRALEKAGKTSYKAFKTAEK